MNRFVLVPVIASLALGARAYEIETHQDLSRLAASLSILGNADVRARIGLGLDINSRRQLFNSSQEANLTVLELIRRGSKYEDDVARSLHHFFDPRNSGSLYLHQEEFPEASPTIVNFVNANAVRSPDWALGEQCPPTLPCNDYSLKSARDYWFKGLTTMQPGLERRRNLGLTFETLGRIIHHLQDMAQPQHVRNDAHFHQDPLDWICPLVQAIPPCGTVTALVRPSAYELWTNFDQVRRTLPTAGYDPVYAPSDPGTDGLSVFNQPRLFWANAGRGIAEFTNRNFLSANTLYQAPPVVGPGVDVDAVALCAMAVPPCSVVVQQGDVVTFYSSVVDDQFRAATLQHPYAMATSIFDAEFNKRTGQRVNSVNRFTFAYDHAYLLPRAVGYSAGFINYFFRGDMEIVRPDDGVYSIVDQSPAGCGDPCGFRRIKLKVKNITAGDEAMGQGKLWAIAKFHLNMCYLPDLSGEDGGDHFRGNSCRSRDESIVVSQSVDVSGVPRNGYLSIQFDFDPQHSIPINASDVFLQVVFRGQLGHETDAVAVATKDISEPTFYGLENVTDYYFDDLGDHKYHPVSTGYSTIDVTDIRIAFGPQADTATPVATMGRLAAGEHAQLALLMDMDMGQPASIAWSGQFGRPRDVVPFDPALFTQDDGGPSGVYQRNCDLVLRRGLYMERGTVFVQQAHGVISWQLLEAPREEAPAMSRLKAARDPRCVHATDGMYDLSAMMPFAASTARTWNINF